MTQEIITGQIAEYNEYRNQVAELVKTNASMVFDYETAKGEKEARSHINTIRLSKGAVERTRKELGADLLIRTRAINDEAKQITAALDGCIEVHAKPLEEKAEREARRVEKIETDIILINLYGLKADVIKDSFSLKQAIIQLEAMPTDHLQERKEEAENQKQLNLEKLQISLSESIQREAEAAELADLRAQKAKQDEIDRIAAQEKADTLKEQKLKEEAAAQAKIEAEAAAQKIIEKAEALAKQAKIDADKVIADAKEAEQQRIADAKIKTDLEEREKAAAQKVESDRIANLEHRKAINNAAKDALIAIGLTDKMAITVAQAIASGEIPSITVNY